MNSIKFLYAAYAATWLIHLFYLGSLVRRYQRLRQRVDDLKRGGKHERL
jgi:CcmD family protein